MDCNGSGGGWGHGAGRAATHLAADTPDRDFDALRQRTRNADAEACAAWFADEGAALRRTAQNYRNLFNPSVGWMRARQPDGAWLEWKGRTTHG